jgi:acetyl-CoA carboxylase biotin carboxyl carrier protein
MADSENNVDDIFELDRIRRLIDLMKEHGLTEVDLRQGDQQIRLARADERPVVGTSFPAMIPTVPQPIAPQPIAPAPVATSPPAEVESSQPVDDENIITIKAPMVGTFYCRPNPNADAYVKVGDHVNEDTTICIIEAMKVFNEIPAEVSGRVVAILVDDDEPLEFGKPLFKIDTSN